MTSVWGPMGWMTLHSVAACYSDTPTPAEKDLILRFITQFAECITCPSCKQHFSAMFATYRRTHPDWNASKFNMFVMVCRMHNSVNMRLDKPRPNTVAECIAQLKRATSVTPQAVFRRNYIAHVIRNWASQHTGESFIFLAAAREMLRINDEYVVSREVDYADLTMPEADVLEVVQEGADIYRVGNGITPFSPMVSPKGFSLRGGRLRLGAR